MVINRRLDKVLRKAKEIVFDNKSKYILFGDCHRGNNSLADDFAHNSSIYLHALKHYFDNGFTYIELGDGEELWENRDFSEIVTEHNDVFCLLNAFHREKRLYLIWGNHDIERRKYKKSKDVFFHNNETKTEDKLFNNIELYEGIVLRQKDTRNSIFLVHGHQGDLINDYLWWLGRFFVRYLWRLFQLFGVKDLTSPAENFKKRDVIEKQIINWVKEENQMIIAGHTHRPSFLAPKGPKYFNVGSCVHPLSITGIEIKDGTITLIKWFVSAKPDGMVFIDKTELAKPEKINDYFS